MRTVELAEAKSSLAHYARKVQKAPVVITSNGRPLAALVPIPNSDAESVSLSQNPKFLAIIDRSRARYKTEGGISPREMARRLGLKRPSRRS